MAMLGFGAARRLSRVALLSLVAEYRLGARRPQGLWHAGFVVPRYLGSSRD